MGITRVKIRAKIVIGVLTVVTPFIQSFSVRKQRGQVGSFDASLKVSHDQVTGKVTGTNVKIYSGTGDLPTQIFTGIIKAAKISPCFDDPEYVILSVSGTDTMSLLQGRKFTRRCRASKTAWCAITGVVRRGLKSGKFTYNTEPVLFKDAGLDKKSDNTIAAGPVGPPSGKKAPESVKAKIAAIDIVPCVKDVVV